MTWIKVIRNSQEIALNLDYCLNFYKENALEDWEVEVRWPKPIPEDVEKTIQEDWTKQGCKFFIFFEPYRNQKTDPFFTNFLCFKTEEERDAEFERLFNSKRK